MVDKGEFFPPWFVSHEPLINLTKLKKPAIENRNSYIEIGEIFFWTATIHNWNRLLTSNEYKEIVVSSLEHLSAKGKIDVFAFVIMPNHIHLIWRINEKNGKESSNGSFLKFTAHEFRKKLFQSDVRLLSRFKVNAINKEYEFWQRDPLAVHLYSENVAYQKMEYIHNNPLADHWNLVKDPTEYEYSSAAFYEGKENRFKFLKDLRDEF